jgi:hypothetical protein
VTVEESATVEKVIVATLKALAVASPQARKKKTTKRKGDFKRRPREKRGRNNLG